MHCPTFLAALMYVLTGGSSVGKTTIINEFEKRGEPVIHEAATDWITSRIHEGIEEFWREEHLGFNILKLQLEREEEFLNSNGRVFLDRGIFDNYGYAYQYNLAGTETLFLIHEALKAINLNDRYEAVFYILPYKDDFIPTNTEVRRDSPKEVGELQAALYAVYSPHRNFIVVPGNMTPEQRADFILTKITNIEKQ